MVLTDSFLDTDVNASSRNQRLFTLLKSREKLLLKLWTLKHCMHSDYLLFIIYPILLVINFPFFAKILVWYSTLQFYKNNNQNFRLFSAILAKVTCPSNATRAN